jgi:hypothetical protein
MLSGSELATAIAAVLMSAVLAGVLLHWFWSYINRSRNSDANRIDEMAARLHEADMAREAAEEAKEQASSLLARREAETAEKLARMRARLDGAVMDREAELTSELDAARLELETMRDGLGNARRRIVDLEAEIEILRAKAQ